MQRLARQRDRHLSAILNGLRATYTDWHMWACLRERQTYTHARTDSRAVDWRQFGFSCNSSPWAWMRNTCVCQSGAMATLPVLWSRPAWGFFLKGEPTGKEEGMQVQTLKHLDRSLAGHPQLANTMTPCKAFLVPTFQRNKWQLAGTSEFLLPNRMSICRKHVVPNSFVPGIRIDLVHKYTHNAHKSNLSQTNKQGIHRGAQPWYPTSCLHHLPYCGEERQGRGHIKGLI